MACSRISRGPGHESRRATLLEVCPVKLQLRHCCTSRLQLVVREVRNTESSGVIVFYSRWLPFAGAAAAYAFVPGQWIAPTTIPQISLLVSAGMIAALHRHLASVDRHVLELLIASHMTLPDVAIT